MTQIKSSNNSIINNIASLTYQRIIKLYHHLIDYRYGNNHNISPNLTLKEIRKYNQNRGSFPTRIICNAPFQHLYFRPNGDITACCAITSTPYGNFKNDKIIDIWKGDSIQSLRNNIENFCLSGSCSGCHHAIKSENYPAFTGRVYDWPFPKKFQNYPTDMTFEISNKCNLECIMCSGEFSSLIRKNVEQLPEIQNPYGDDFFKEIKEFLPHLKRARFMGGEPFLIREYSKILDFLVSNNPSCQIYIQTNGTILNNFVKKIIESPNVRLSLSIDSLEKDSYQKIRKNASYQRMMENLEYFSNLSQKRKHTININFCSMKINWKELPQMINFCEQNHFSLNILPVENPRHLSLRTCKEDELSEMMVYLSSFKDKIQDIALREVYHGHLNHLSALRKNTSIIQKRKAELLQYTLDEMLQSADQLFCNINAVKNFEDIQNVFSTAFNETISGNEQKKKSILADLIIDLERVNNTAIVPQSFEELVKKTRFLLRQTQEELD